MRIKAIKPKEAQQKRLRVCAYVRVSVASAELEESLEEQRLYFYTLITSNPEWEFAGLYVDDGISGFIDQRPQFQAMMNDARERKFDLIMAKSISRFARNTETLLKATRELKKLGIGVYFELQRTNTLTTSGELLLTIKAAFAQGESESGSRLVKMSYQHRFSRGIVTPQIANTYGFHAAKDGSIQIDAEQASIVKLIFDLAEQGVWCSKISAKLNKQGIPSPDGKQWYDRQINKMLRNVMYKGDVLLQKTFTNEFRKTCKNKGEVQSWYIREDHEPIVSIAQWENVQRVLDERTNSIEDAKRKRKAPKPSPRSYHSRYPLSGLMYCPHCGAVLHHKWCNNGKDEYWVCSTNIKKRASSCKGIFLPAAVTQGWDIQEPVIVQRFEDENGMIQFTAFPKEEYELMKGE